MTQLRLHFRSDILDTVIDHYMNAKQSSYVHYEKAIQKL